MEEKIQFTPFTKILFELLAELNPVQVYDYEGMDIRDINEFELEGRSARPNATRLKSWKKSACRR